MKYLLILLSLILISCGSDQKLRTICTCDQKKEIMKWVQSSIKDANNMADEEMEDVIKELRRTSYR